ncbi:MAG: SH3 domain-containing protein [Aquificaceae bacterium]
MKWIVIILTIKLGLASSSFFVTSIRAQLFEEPRLGARVVGELRKGEEVRLIDKRSGWALVERQGQRGWVFEYFISSSPSPERISLPKIAGRREAHSGDDAAVTRGVTGEKSGKVSSVQVTRKPAEPSEVFVLWLDKFLVKEEEILRFERGEWP